MNKYKIHVYIQFSVLLFLSFYTWHLGLEPPVHKQYGLVFSSPTTSISCIF